LAEWVDARGEDLMQFFGGNPATERAKEMAQSFRVLAQEIVETVPRNPQRRAALQRLLEARDCVLRALVYRELES
jgi:hypothetical protein